MSTDPAQKNAVLNKLIGTVIGVRNTENNAIGRSKKKVNKYESRSAIIQD